MKPLLARFPHETWPGFNRLEEVVLPAQPALQRLVLRLREWRRLPCFREVVRRSMPRFPRA